jgi:hypothetical protein
MSWLRHWRRRAFNDEHPYANLSEIKPLNREGREYQPLIDASFSIIYTPALANTNGFLDKRNGSAAGPAGAIRNPCDALVHCHGGNEFRCVLGYSHSVTA